MRGLHLKITVDNSFLSTAIKVTSFSHMLSVEAQGSVSSPVSPSTACKHRDDGCQHRKVPDAPCNYVSHKGGQEHKAAGASNSNRTAT